MLRILTALSSEAKSSASFPATVTRPSPQAMVSGCALPVLSTVSASAIRPHLTFNAPLSAVSRNIFAGNPQHTSASIQRMNFSTFQQAYTILQDKDLKDRASNIGVILLFALGVLLLGHKIYRDNNPQGVVDSSILPDALDDPSIAPLLVGQARLKLASPDKTSGRSKGYRVKKRCQDGSREIYYYKEPFKRSLYLNELVLGALGYILFKDEEFPFPKVYAVEKQLDTYKGTSAFALLSQDLAGGDTNSNLEDFAFTNADKGFVADDFTNLGIVAAWSMLFGNSDFKLANVVRSSKGACYAIDHEAAFSDEPVRLVSGAQGLKALGEFRDKSFNDRQVEATSDGAIDTNDNVRQRIKSDKGMKQMLQAAMEEAIQSDIDSGKVHSFYQRFADIKDEELEIVLGSFGPLIKPDEKASFRNAIKERQTMVRAFLEKDVREIMGDMRHGRFRYSL